MAGLFGEEWAPTIHFFNPLPYTYKPIVYGGASGGAEGGVTPQGAVAAAIGAAGSGLPMPPRANPSLTEKLFSGAKTALGTAKKARGLMEEAGGFIDNPLPTVDFIDNPIDYSIPGNDPSSMGAIGDEIASYTPEVISQDPSSMGAVGDEIAAQQAANGITLSQGLGGLTAAYSLYDMARKGVSPANFTGAGVGGMMMMGAPGIAALPMMLPLGMDALNKNTREMNFRSWDNQSGPYHIDEQGNKYFLPQVQGLRGDPYQGTIRWNAETKQWERPQLADDWEHPVTGDDDVTPGTKVESWQPMKLMRGPDGEPYFHPGSKRDDAYSVSSFNQHLNYDLQPNEEYWQILNGIYPSPEDYSVNMFGI